MPNLEQFISKMRDFQRDLEENFPEAILEGAITGKSLIQNRIQETGQGSNGAAFGDYTERTKKIRQDKGMQVIFVDLTDTGRMWSNIGVTDFKRDSDGAVAIIGGKNDETRFKLRENTERFGPVMDLSLLEEQNVVDTVDFGIGKIIDRNFG